MRVIDKVASLIGVGDCMPQVLDDPDRERKRVKDTREWGLRLGQADLEFGILRRRERSVPLTEFCLVLTSGRILG
jgi:hypothetical protein